MEERAPGGELRLLPERWLVITCFGVPPTPEERERCASLPSVPLTRMQWMEQMAFASTQGDE